MEKDLKPSIPETESSDTIVELKASLVPEESSSLEVPLKASIEETSSNQIGHNSEPKFPSTQITSTLTEGDGSSSGGCTISETKSSDTIIDLKANLAEAGCSSSATEHIVQDNPKNVSTYESNPEKKGKPAPLDVTAAQDLQETMTEPKTPTSAPPIAARRKIKERKIGHRRVNQEGEITFKKIETSKLMGSIQLGLGYSIGSLASKPERDLLMEDFTIIETLYFPKEGSNLTPAHHYSDFKFKTYAPGAFRFFRDLFGIQPDDFLLSLCNYPLTELSNPGASGSIFYVTDDDQLIIKTVDHREAEFLTKLLPGYYMNLNQNPRTLLPKFFGLYCYQCGGKNIRLVVMNNLLPSFIKLHQRYDLKGSTYKRKASKAEKHKSSPTWKDLDFMEQHKEGIFLQSDTYNALIKTLQRDCRVLQSFKIMDYSLLIGIHNLDLAKREKEQARKEEATNGKVSDSGSDSASPSAKQETSLVRSKSINRTRLAAFSTAMESIQASEVDVPENDEDDVPPGGIPAKNAKGESLLLFLGIIDTLQSFRLKKRLEHTFKSVIHDGDTVSVHRPGFYAQRFLDFMSKTVFKKLPSLKHSPSKRKGASKGESKKSSATTDRDPKLPQRLPKIPSENENSQEDAASVPFPSTFSEIESTNVTSDLKSNTSWNSSKERGRQKTRSDTDPVLPPQMVSLRSGGSVGKASSVSWDKTEVVSLSQVTIQTESTADCVSETSSSSTSGLGSTLHTVTWTPPHSVEGSTPTHTEGTPSFTESSSSGDAACPTTPVRSINKSLDSLPPLGETQVLQGSEMMKENLVEDIQKM